MPKSPRPAVYSKFPVSLIIGVNRVLGVVFWLSVVLAVGSWLFSGFRGGDFTAAMVRLTGVLLILQIALGIAAYLTVRKLTGGGVIDAALDDEIKGQLNELAKTDVSDEDVRRVRREFKAAAKEDRQAAWVPLASAPGKEARMDIEANRMRVRTFLAPTAEATSQPTETATAGATLTGGRFNSDHVNAAAAQYLIDGFKEREARGDTLTAAGVEELAQMFAYRIKLHPDALGEWRHEVNQQTLENLLQEERNQMAAEGISQAEIDAWEAQMVTALNDA